MLLATISNSFLVSALNSFFSVWEMTGSGSFASIIISFCGCSYEEKYLIEGAYNSILLGFCKLWII